MRPRYYRARNSHCFFVRNIHLYVYVNTPYAYRRRHAPTDVWRETGITIKRRRHNGTWRHTALFVRYRREDALLLHLELVTHLSTEFRRGRVPLSKRYLRFRVCL